ncbi:LppU/SCO3897 family protein [Streptomyces hoynatensis]|uniref:Uncharacterized protein n=1 Tax=Streptomyces hoynatensis TaxID=1141874 RepID=A0A3A9Z6P4_9ACTN|nr:hypothetical protein [Streptomyces hoynatensis]RKN43975.1 hypothetical protein D7294_09850 [Streptomyces hoynatensis]
MSGIQGWPGAGAGPGGPAAPAGSQGASEGQRFAILALVVALVVAGSFGLAKATGADALGSGSGPAALGPGPGEMPDLDGLGGEDVDDGLGGTGDDLGGGDPGSGGTSDGGDVYTEPTPTPTPTQTDPTLEHFRSITAGDCLNDWMISDTEWASDVPEVVSCSDEAAGVRVSQTSGDTSDCPTDAGRSYLYYSSGLETVALCVTRQFAVGQCFLGMPDGSANLMSWFDCAATEVPSPYNQLYNVTSVYSAPANPTGDECRQSSTDQNTYWWWTVDGESVLVCAVVYS